MDHKEKADNPLSGKSVADLIGEVFGLEQAEARQSLNDLMKVMKRLDAHCRKNGKPASCERDFRDLKNFFIEKKEEKKMEQKNKELIGRIVDQSGESYWARVGLISQLSPEAGKVLMQAVVEAGKSGLMLVYALRRTTEAPKANQIGVHDLDWFLPAAITIVGEIETESWSGEEADYGRLLKITADTAVRTEASKRLRQQAETDRPQYSGCCEKIGYSVRLALLFEGRLKEALQPLPWKKVNWQTVRNVANGLTNQLFKNGPNSEETERVSKLKAHISDFPQGSRREFTMEPGRKGGWISSKDFAGGWHVFEEEDVCRLYWRSCSSNNALEAVKEEGQWLLRYIPSPVDPEYRGLYYDLYQVPENAWK